MFVAFVAVRPLLFLGERPYFFMCVFSVQLTVHCGHPILVFHAIDNNLVAVLRVPFF